MSKFCKICKDSGKPNSVVHSYNVRERGKVVCPILLSTECRYCRVKGHTPKFCPKIKDREMYWCSSLGMETFALLGMDNAAIFNT